MNCSFNASSLQGKIVSIVTCWAFAGQVIKGFAWRVSLWTESQRVEKGAEGTSHTDVLAPLSAKWIFDILDGRFNAGKGRVQWVSSITYDAVSWWLIVLFALWIKDDTFSKVVEGRSNTAFLAGVFDKLGTVWVHICNIFSVFDTFSIKTKIISNIALKTFTSQWISSLAWGINLSAFSVWVKERSRRASDTNILTPLSTQGVCYLINWFQCANVQRVKLVSWVAQLTKTWNAIVFFALLIQNNTLSEIIKSGSKTASWANFSFPFSTVDIKDLLDCRLDTWCWISIEFIPGVTGFTVVCFIVIFPALSITNDTKSDGVERSSKTAFFTKWSFPLGTVDVSDWLYGHNTFPRWTQLVSRVTIHTPTVGDAERFARIIDLDTNFRSVEIEPCWAFRAFSIREWIAIGITDAL